MYERRRRSLDINQLKGLREALNLPRTEVARQLEISCERLRRFEKGGEVMDKKLVLMAYKQLLKERVELIHSLTKMK